MLLVDAAQIHVGGAVEVLKMLVEELNRTSKPYVLIQDKRLKIKIEGAKKTITPTRPIIGRRKVYQSIIDDYEISRVISLVNFPPPYKLGVPTVTYFHNMNVLASADTRNFGWKYQFMQSIKRRYLARKIDNTDYYIFQSSRAQSKFLSEFVFDSSRCEIFPFYNERRILEVKQLNIQKTPKSFVYISLDYPHKNHHLLLDVWDSLLADGIHPELTLSIPVESIELCNRINKLNLKGGKIKNLGVTDYQNCLINTAKAEFCIYPSKSESLGLGLVESQILGNKILASDLGYVHQSVEPSMVFDPDSLESIKSAVIAAISTDLPQSNLKLSNRLEDFVNFVDTII